MKMKKNRCLVIWPSNPSSSAWSVLRIVHTISTCGQISEAGQIYRERQGRRRQLRKREPSPEQGATYKETSSPPGKSQTGELSGKHEQELEPVQNTKGLSASGIDGAERHVNSPDWELDLVVDRARHRSLERVRLHVRHARHHRDQSVLLQYKQPCKSADALPESIDKRCTDLDVEWPRVERVRLSPEKWDSRGDIPLGERERPGEHLAHRVRDQPDRAKKLQGQTWFREMMKQDRERLTG